ncbi:BTAD domain-containing putative transcriptional regulator [Kitasatospora sp. NPDC052896]|uniref:BTAD domain-containing putative transcriptional regulator n=1 Tax=Kitasatospora sp. NPDC052896 TaxID=3364061 RepID=UPI0037CC7C68
MLDPSATGQVIARSSVRPAHPAESMETLHRALSAATAGRDGAALLVRGEAGIGRTTFLGEAALLAERLGFRTAWARSHPPVHEERLVTVRQLREELDRGGSGPTRTGRPLCHTAGAGTGLYRSVAAAQTDRPVLLAIDDLQWCDAWSLREVSHLLHRRTGLRVVVLAALRGDLPATHPEACRDVVTAMRQLRLRGLDRTAAEQLVRSVLPGTPDPGFVTACLRATRGNPRLLLALLTELAEHGVEPDRMGAGLLARFAPEVAAQHVLAVAGGPDSDAWRLAAALAVLGGRATLERAAALAGLPLEGAAHAADLLFRAELLATGRPLAFSHPIVGDAVARHLPAGTAAWLHGRAAVLAPATATAPTTAAAPTPVTTPAALTPPAAPPVTELRCLGGFRLVLRGHEVDCSSARPKTRSLLRLLALHGGRAVHREVLLDALWPDLPSDAGVRNLQVTVSRLRVLLGPGLLVRTGASYGLALDGELVSDVREFEHAADAARGYARATGEERAAGLRAARRWYGGDLLPEEGPAEWVVEERARLRARAAEVSALLAEAELATGRIRAAVRAAEESLRLEPFHDAAWRTLIDAYRRAGDRASSEQASRRYDDMLSSLA